MQQGGNNRYGIEMTKGLDPILLICLCILVDAIKEKEEK